MAGTAQQTPYPQTMEELHLHAIAVDGSAADATASFGRECASYLLAEGWTIRTATDTVGGLRLPRDRVAEVVTLDAVPGNSPFLGPSAELRLQPQKRERHEALLEWVRSRAPSLGERGVAVFAHPHHAPAPPLAPEERQWLDFYLQHDEKWLVGPHGQPGAAFSSLVRDVWSDSIGLARLQALQATASDTQALAPTVRLRPIPGAAGVPITAASAPFQPAYTALPAYGTTAGSAVDDADST